MEQPRPARGAPSRIWVPVSGAAPVAATRVPHELPRGSGEVVMIVDDEPVLVGLAEEMLARLGYQPSGFRSSSAALDAFRADPQRFDIVLTDETMPELTGTSLALQIRQLRPDIPIVLMSGRPDSAIVARAGSAGIHQVLCKPLQMRDIADSIARALAVTSEPPTGSRGQGHAP